SFFEKSPDVHHRRKTLRSLRGMQGQTGPGIHQAKDFAQHIQRIIRGSPPMLRIEGDRKSTRLNSSHGSISYAVFCLKKKKEYQASSSDDATILPSRCRTRRSQNSQATTTEQTTHARAHRNTTRDTEYSTR